MEDHKTVDTDTDFDITFHPAFASTCKVKPKNGGERVLYSQPEGDVVNCKEKGHPKKHVIKLKGKGNRRDITITVDDPEHSIHSLSFELYDEGRAPGDSYDDSFDTFTVQNDAKTCPPYCDPI